MPLRTGLKAGKPDLNVTRTGLNAPGTMLSYETISAQRRAPASEYRELASESAAGNDASPGRSNCTDCRTSERWRGSLKKSIEPS